MKCPLIALASFVAGAILTYIITSNGILTPLACPKFDYSKEAPFQKVSSATALALSSKYAIECEPALRRLRPQSADTNMDARSCNFSLPMLKKYIWDLESKLCNQNEISVNDLGIRFYYGKYPDLNLNEFADLSLVPKKEYSHRHTLFLVPTIKDGELIKDMNPDDMPSILADGKTGDLNNNFLMNHGNICPPPFPTPASSRSAGMNY